MDLDRQSDIAALDTTLTTVERVLDVDGLRAKIEKLEHEAADPNLWNDQNHAQKVTSELSHAQGELRRVEGLRSRLDDLPVLYELAAEEDGAGGSEALAEADAELKSLQADVEAMEVRTLLSGEYDEREALVNIRLLPGDTIAEVCERVRKIIGDERVKMQAKEGCAWEASPVSPIDGPAFESLELTIRQVFDSVPVTPYVVLGATDSRHYADLCPQVYRFTPYLVDSTDLKRMHGVDERISLDSLSSMVQFYRLLIIRWFGAEED